MLLIDAALAAGAPPIPLAVADTGWLALVGGRGAGKSALLAFVAGLPGPVRGTLALDGRRLDRLRADRRGFGVLLPGAPLLPRRTVAALIGLPLGLRGIGAGARRRRVRQLIEEFGLAPLAGRDAASLAPLDRRRVALAVALVRDPPVLLVDDALRGLDPGDRAAWIDTLARLRRDAAAGTRALAVILADRDPAILGLADHGALLADGRLLQHDTPRALHDRPSGPVAAALTGPVNLLPGTIQAAEDDATEVRLAAGIRVTADAIDPDDGARAPAGAQDPPPPAAGDRCIVGIRPDRIAVASVAAADLGDDALDATLVDLREEAEAMLLRLRLQNGQILLARRPAAASRAGLAPGRPVAIAWQARHAHVWRADPGPTADVTPGATRAPHPLFRDAG